MNEVLAALEKRPADGLFELDWERRPWRLRARTLVENAARAARPACRPFALSLDAPRALGLGTATRALRALPASAREPRSRILLGLGRVQEAWLSGARRPLTVGDFEAASRAPARGAWELAERAEARRLRGDAAGARRDFDAALAENPDADLLALRSRLGRPDDLSAALELEPRAFWALLHLGWSLLARNKPAAAAAAFARAARARPESAWAEAWRARSLEAAGERKAAAAARARAVTLDPGCVWAELSSWDGAPAGDLASMLVECEARLARDPRDAAAWALRGECRDQHALVIADLTRAIELDPARPWFHASLARVLLYQGRADEASASLDAAVALDASCGWLYAWRGEIRKRQNRLKEALADQNLAVRLAPLYPRARVWRASLRAAAGDLEGALADFDAGLELDGDYAWGLAERARTLARLGRPAAAREDRARAQRLDPRLGRAPARASRARALAAARSDPWRAWPYAQLCALELSAKRPARALEALRRFRALSIKDCGACVLEARLQRRLGRPQEGARAAAAACVLDPENAWPRQELALCLLAAGDADSAFLAQRQALAAGSQGPWRFGLEGRVLLRAQDPFADADAELARFPVRARAWASYWRGWLLCARGRTRAGLPFLRAAAARRGRPAVWARGRLAELALHAGKTPDLALLNAFCRGDRRCAWLAALQGEALARAGRPEEAAAAYERALALDPEEFTALLGRARQSQAAGRCAPALADLDAALAQEGRAAWLLRWRAELLEALGRLSEAEATLARALELHGQYAQAREDLARVRARLAEAA